MQDESGAQPDFQPRVRRPSGCYRAGAITCAVVAIAAMVVVILFYVLVLRHPGVKNLFGSAQLAATCQEQLGMVGQALQRYEIRYERYPDRLADLYPGFLSKKDLLKCPADKRSVEAAFADSYTYVKPAPGAPGDTPVVICNRHILLPGSPPLTLVLQKDGKVVPSPATPLPGRRTSRG